jgi:hypothetical protein
MLLGTGKAADDAGRVRPYRRARFVSPLMVVSIRKAYGWVTSSAGVTPQVVDERFAESVPSRLPKLKVGGDV